MSWKKVIESKDIVVFEKRFKSFLLKIEARQNEDGKWQVFQTRIENASSSLVSQNTLNSKNEALDLIRYLKTKKGENIQKELSPIFKRLYKEDFIEKWSFYIDDDKENFIMVRYGEETSIDIVMHEKYSVKENQILEKIEDMLGLDDMGMDISYSVYYYISSSKSKKIVSKPFANVVFGNIEFGFDSK